MIQKIIKVGDSAAVVLPKKALAQIHFKIGDSILLNINESLREVTLSHPEKQVDESSKWADGFIKRYKKALNALADK